MDLLELFKRIKPFRLAKFLNIPPSTIYSWKKSGIPSWRVSAVIDVCQKLGVDISDCISEDK